MEIADKKESVDLGQVDDLQILPSEDVQLCTDFHENDILIVHQDTFTHAKQAELSNWRKNNVFEEQKDEGQICISTKWVCTLKETTNGIVPKARLVARGFEEINTQEPPKESPTCASLKMVMAVICQNK